MRKDIDGARTITFAQGSATTMSGGYWSAKINDEEYHWITADRIRAIVNGFPIETIDELCAQMNAWHVVNCPEYERQSADELLFEMVEKTGNDHRTEWLRDFIERWDTSVEVEQLSRAFSRQIREQLAEHLEAINKKNEGADVYSSVCATHDYADANMIMRECCDRIDSALFERIDIVNCAWAVSKQEGFK